MYTTAQICIFTHFTFSCFQPFSHFSAFFLVLRYFFPSLVIFLRLQRCSGEILIQQMCPWSCLFLSFLNFIFFPDSDEWALKIFTGNNFWNNGLEARAAFAPEPPPPPPPPPKSSLAGDIAAFVIKMHRPASAPANKNAFHGWLNLIVLSARTEGINVFG